MSEGCPREHANRLLRVAADFVMPTRSSPDLAQAVVLAEDMVASGCEDPTTIEVAALPRSLMGATASHSYERCCASSGIALPPAGDEEGEYELLLHAFGLSDLPLSNFERHFWPRLPAVDEQNDLQRTLTQLLDDLDHADLASRGRVIQSMREAVRRAHTEALGPPVGRREALDYLTEEAAAAGLYDGVPDYREALKAARKRRGD